MPDFINERYFSTFFLLAQFTCSATKSNAIRADEELDDGGKWLMVSVNGDARSSYGSSTYATMLNAQLKQGIHAGSLTVSRTETSAHADRIATHGCATVCASGGANALHIAAYGSGVLPRATHAVHMARHQMAVQYNRRCRQSAAVWVVPYSSVFQTATWTDECACTVYAIHLSAQERVNSE